MTDTLVKFKDGESVLLKNVMPLTIVGLLNEHVDPEAFFYLDGDNTGIAVRKETIASIIKVERPGKSFMTTNEVRKATGTY